MGTAAGSAGMFLFAPFSQMLIDALGWSDSLLIMSAMMLIVPVLAVPLRGNSSSGTQKQTDIDQSIGEALREAFGHQSYLLLTAGFFVCGFQVAFITAHFPAYIGDIGIDARYAVIGHRADRLLQHHRFARLRRDRPEIFQADLPGADLYWPLHRRHRLPAAAADRHERDHLLGVMGLLWLSTVPPTNSLVAIMFGTRYLGMLGGIVFLSHQIGSFLGVWLGGYLYDIFGTYDPVWWLGVALGLFAAIVHWPIKERPVARPVAA
jgi:MFS family permease